MQHAFAQLLTPLGLSLGLMGLALLLLALRRRTAAAGFLSLSVLWLGAWSLPVVADRLLVSFEGRFDNRPVADLPAADAVIVLGGGVGQVPRDWPYPDLGSAADRVWHAARIYRAGKAEIVIVSGGRFAGRQDWLSEAQAMRIFLLDLGVPDDAIVLEEESRNTRENAVHVARLVDDLELESLLLATSALHMPRAHAAFARAGLEAFPAPTDFRVVPRSGISRWVPNADALAASTGAWHEHLGLWVYRWRGWVS